MTADQAAGFQSWHERLTATWHGLHRDLAQLEAERDRKLSDIQRQYQQLVAGAWHDFHSKAGVVMGNLWESVDDQEQQAAAEPLPLPAPTGDGPSGSGSDDLTAIRDQVQHGPGQRARPPWEDAPAPPPAAAPPDAGGPPASPGTP